MGIPFNCPYCGQPLTHELTQDRWHFYDCRTCGPFILSPGGDIRRRQPDDIRNAGLADEEAAREIERG